MTPKKRGSWSFWAPWGGRRRSIGLGCDVLEGGCCFAFELVCLCVEPFEDRLVHQGAWLRVTGEADAWQLWVMERGLIESCAGFLGFLGG
jgi:hypothetical protein